MKRFLGIGILLVFVLYFILPRTNLFVSPKPKPTDVNTVTSDTTAADTAANTNKPQQVPRVIADNLHVPWDIVFLPNGAMLVSERSGNILLITETEKRQIHKVGSYESGEGGLLGMTLHPKFTENNYLYLYYTYQALSDGTTKNKVERYTYQDETLTKPLVIIDNIPGARYHDGGRIAFGPDAHLYITTGDAGKANLAQDINSLAGKILRLRDDGSIPNDNPFPNSPIYSYGHRNPQGITWGSEGNLWSTEHGRSGIRSGLDEVNLITAGSNYGWPDSQGDTIEQGTEGPKAHSGANVTWAPAGAAYHNGSIYFGGLRGEAVYKAVLNGTTIVEIQRQHYKQFGRIRTTIIGPDAMLYITTSNTDGRGTTQPKDDKIIRLPLQ